VVLVLDGASPDVGPRAVLERLAALSASRPVLLVLNKSDLSGFGAAAPAFLAHLPAVETSALTGAGIDRLVDGLGRLLAGDDAAAEPLLSTARQHRAVTAAIDHAASAAARLREGAYPELAADDLRRAREALASLFGRDAGEALLDEVFSTFCLGK